MIAIKVFVQGINISVISIYTSQCGLDDSQKDNFYDSPINVMGEQNYSPSRRLQ